MSFPFQNNFNSTYGNGYGFGTPYGSYMQQTQQCQPQTQSIPMPPKTTKIYVTSQEEALARQVEPNTQIPYFHQNGKMVFDVYTDQWGRKEVQAYNLIPIEEKNVTNGVLRAEFEDLKARLERIESSFLKSNMEEVEVKNVQSERTE